MSDRYAVVTLDEMALGQVGAHWHPVRRTLGIQAFGINAWTATAAGQQVIGEHDESEGEEHEEVYVVVSGHATFTLDGKTFDAPAGTVVHVPDPSVRRGAVGESGTTILAVGAKPGAVFTPSPWERTAEALRYWETEEWDKAIAVLEEHLAETPDSGLSHYNLGCALARAGRREEALAHIQEAATMEARFLELAQTDDDLASIRDDPSFPRP
ncbi:MAG TPA: tetratricopeptide repeat protein [Gaiella sp.]|nr:tetratricopeptide repeat protein [Gaiella sp.]